MYVTYKYDRMHVLQVRRTTEIVIRCGLFATANFPTAPPEHKINVREQNKWRRNWGPLEIFDNQLVPLVVEVFVRVIVDCIERYTIKYKKLKLKIII